MTDHGLATFQGERKNTTTTAPRRHLSMVFPSSPPPRPPSALVDLLLCRENFRIMSHDNPSRQITSHSIPSYHTPAHSIKSHHNHNALHPIALHPIHPIPSHPRPTFQPFAYLQKRRVASHPRSYPLRLHRFEHLHRCLAVPTVPADLHEG